RTRRLPRALPRPRRRGPPVRAPPPRRTRPPALQPNPLLHALLQQQPRHRPHPGDPGRGAAMTLAARRSTRRPRPSPSPQPRRAPSMTLESINPEDLPTPPAYTHGTLLL